MTTEFILKGLHCESCGKVAHMKLKKMEGVTDVRIHQQGDEAHGEVDAERTISIEEIQAALADTGYKAFMA